MTFSFDASEILPPTFYRREAHDLAAALLGKHLVRHVDDDLLVGRVVEVEVYGGADDPSCHADSGVPTDRTQSMYAEPGTAYVYTIYGMYQCLNIVAPRGPRGKAAAILVRALEPIAGIAAMAARRGVDTGPPWKKRDLKKLMSGPGKLCQAMDIGREHDGRLLYDPELCLVDAEPVPAERIASTERIGLNPDTCGESTYFEWRYVVADSDFISRKLKR